MSYIFGGNTGLTYEDIQRQRELADAMRARRKHPQTFGEGLSAIGEAIAARRMRNKADKGAKEQQSQFQSVFQTILGGGGDAAPSGGMSPANTTPAPATIPRDMGSSEPAGYRGDTVQHGGVTYDMGRSDVSNYADAIASVESGGRYDAVGPEVKGNRAYGRYQVMDFNIGPWTKEVLGRELTPQEFLASPEAQDAVFNAKFGSYVEKYGNPQDAASVWFSGRPMAQAGNASDGYTTVPEYVQRFTGALGQPPQGAGVQVASNDPSAGLGMIGGVKPGGGVWQSFDGSGRAHAANPQYEDYSQLFREYRFDPPDDSWVPVGERDGKTVYASPDYARDESGNYMSVSAAEAQQLAQQRGSIIPTRDEVRGMYERAQQIPMPTSADFGKPGGQGTSDEYTQAVTRAAQQMGIDPNTPIVHGKEFFGQPQQPQQGQRVAQAMPETQMQPGALQMPFTPTGGRMEPGLGQQPQQPQQPPQAPQMSVQQAQQRVLQVQSLIETPGFREFTTPQQRAQAQMELARAQSELEAAKRQSDPRAQLEIQKMQLEVQRMQRDLETGNQTAAMQEYEFARQQGYQGTFQDYKREMAQAGAPSVSTTVNTGDAPDSRPMADKPPKGFQRRWDPEQNSWVDEPIPGGEADRERQQAADKAAERERQRRIGMGTTLTNLQMNIDEIKNGGMPVTGPFGALLGAIPSTAASDWRVRNQQITTEGALAELQKMRENSPTGGAVGQLSDDERRAMAIAATGISDAQSADEYVRAAENYRRTMLDIALKDENGNTIPYEIDDRGNVIVDGQVWIGTDNAQEAAPQGGGAEIPQQAPDYLSEQDKELWEYFTDEERRTILEGYTR